MSLTYVTKRYGDGMQEKNEANQWVQKVAGARGWGRDWTSLSCKVGEYPCLLKIKVHAIWLKQPVGTKKGWQPPWDVASHLPVSTILRYRLLMCLLHARTDLINSFRVELELLPQVFTKSIEELSFKGITFK